MMLTGSTRLATVRKTVVGNTSRNRFDGVDTDGPNAVIAKNVADTNGFNGIEAPTGVVDGGGNKAHHNAAEDCSKGVIVCK